MKTALLSLVRTDIQQIRDFIEEFEKKGVVTDILVDTELSTVYLLTRMAGNCFAKSIIVDALRSVYLPWMRAAGVKSGKCEVSNAAGSQYVPNCAFYFPPRQPSNFEPRNSQFPQLALEVEFSEREDRVNTKLQRFYWQPAFSGENGTKVDEVWGIFLPSPTVYYEIGATVLQTPVPAPRGSCLQPQNAVTAMRPAGYYLIIYTRTYPDLMYELSPGNFFVPPEYSVAAAAPAICVTSFLQAVHKGLV